MYRPLGLAHLLVEERSHQRGTSAQEEIVAGVCARCW